MTNLTVLETLKKENNKVVMSDGKIYDLQKTVDGKEYVFLKNRRSGALLGTYCGRIKDAIEDIREGYGHAIVSSKTFGTKFEKVIYFLNQTDAEKYRKKTLKEFENVDFAYLLEFGPKDSYFRSFYYDLKSRDSERPVFFDTEEAVESFLQSIEEKIKKKAKNYNQLKTEDEKKLFLEKEDLNQFEILMLQSTVEGKELSTRVVQTVKF